MKKLLNNPIVILTLVIVAAVVLYFNVIQPIIGSNNVANYTTQEIHPPMEEVMGMAYETVSKNTNTIFANKINLDQIQKKLKFKRDPFTFSDTIKIVISSRADALPDAVKLRPELNAVISSNGQNFAVINGEIVSIGDKVGDFTLIAINTNQVTVEDSTETLTLVVDASPQISGKNHE